MLFYKNKKFFWVFFAKRARFLLYRGNYFYFYRRRRFSRAFAGQKQLTYRGEKDIIVTIVKKNAETIQEKQIWQKNVR